MGGRLRTMGIAAAALSLLLVAGPATVALADGPDTAHVAITSSYQGLGEALHPVGSAWQGLGQELHPVVPNPVTQTGMHAGPSRSGGGSGAGTLAVALGIGLAALAGIGLTVTFRRRARFAI